jgi:hypothetical protein
VRLKRVAGGVYSTEHATVVKLAIDWFDQYLKAK